MIPVAGSTKDYYMSINSFVSDSLKQTIDPNDITTISFSIENPTGRNAAINSTISNVSFTTEDVSYLQSLQAKEVMTYPNPVTGGTFTCNFTSDQVYQLNLRVVELSTGRTILTQPVTSVVGSNNVQVNLGNNLNTNMYIVELGNDQVQFKNTKIVVGSR